MLSTSRISDRIPLVVAHRGACGYRPEHTLAAYQLAIDMGADYIEPDVVSTSDGVLVARHENEISGTSDVADRHEFADRLATKKVDDAELTGWFTEDFTIAELKTLRAKERLPGTRVANTRYDGQFGIATLDEIIDLVDENNARRPEPVGLYVETKHPTYFDSIGINIDDLLLGILTQRGLNRAGTKVIIESMEPQNLRSLKNRTQVPLIQLFMDEGQPYDFTVAGDPRSYADLMSADQLAEIATYADGIGPNKDQVIARDAEGRLAAETGLVADAHAAGLLVHIWTMRDENRFLPTGLRRGDDKNAKGEAVTEYERFFDAGVDGVFTDNVDTAIEARKDWLASRS